MGARVLRQRQAPRCTNRQSSLEAISKVSARVLQLGQALRCAHLHRYILVTRFPVRRVDSNHEPGRPEISDEPDKFESDEFGKYKPGTPESNTGHS